RSGSMAQQRTLQYLAVGLLTDAPQPRRAHTRCTTCPRPLSPVDPSMANGSVRRLAGRLSIVFTILNICIGCLCSYVRVLQTDGRCVYTSLCRMWTTAQANVFAARPPCGEPV